MLPKDNQVLGIILHRIETVLGYCKNRSVEDFVKDSMLAEACVFNLLQIGEACSRGLSDNFKNRYPEIPWRQISGLRNRIVHGYDDVQMTIIWETITGDLAGLHDKLMAILQEKV
jgi:uncharacterized protein with HEPN domain